MTLFTDGQSNTKTAKGSGKGFETKILHMAPAMESGYEVCASRSAGCTAACLYTAGRGRMENTKKARIRRTLLWFEQREVFKQTIITELVAFVKRNDKNGTIPTVRMNGTSDIIWEKAWPELFSLFPTIRFYDYTKHFKRCLDNWAIPDNYHLTFSRSECNDDQCETVLRHGKWNVAAVFDSKDFPNDWKGWPTYSADNDDLRFLDPKGSSVGCLYAKGDGKKDKTGFVLPVL